MTAQTRRRRAPGIDRARRTQEARRADRHKHTRPENHPIEGAKMHRKPHHPPPTTCSPSHLRDRSRTTNYLPGLRVPVSRSPNDHGRMYSVATHDRSNAERGAASNRRRILDAVRTFVSDARSPFFGRDVTLARHENPGAYSSSSAPATNDRRPTPPPRPPGTSALSRPSSPARANSQAGPAPGIRARREEEALRLRRPRTGGDPQDGK